MDMSKFVPRWINNTELRRLGGRYQGFIERVIVQEVHNRFARKHRSLRSETAAGDDGVTYKQPEPVIVFEDGYRLVPNIGMRRMLMERFGTDSDSWVGQPLIVVCRIDGAGRLTKHVLFPDEREESKEPPWTIQHVTDFSDPIGAHDDDSVDAEGHCARRRW